MKLRFLLTCVALCFSSQVSAKDECSGFTYDSNLWERIAGYGSSSCISTQLNDDGDWSVSVSKFTIDLALKIISDEDQFGTPEFEIKLQELSDKIDDGEIASFEFSLPPSNGDCEFSLDNGTKFPISNTTDCRTTKGMIGSILYRILDLEVNVLERERRTEQKVVSVDEALNFDDFLHSGGFLKTFLEMTGFEPSSDTLKAALFMDAEIIESLRLAEFKLQANQYAGTTKIVDERKMSSRQAVPFSFVGVEFSEGRSGNFAAAMTAAAIQEGWRSASAILIDNQCRSSGGEVSNQFRTLNLEEAILEHCQEGFEFDVIPVADTIIASQVFQGDKPIEWNFNASLRNAFGKEWTEYKPIAYEDFVLWHVPELSGATTYEDFLGLSDKPTRRWRVGGSTNQISTSQDEFLVEYFRSKYRIDIEYVDLGNAANALEALEAGGVDFTFSNPYEYFSNVNSSSEISPLVVFSEEPLPYFRGVRTASQLGYDDVLRSVTSAYISDDDHFPRASADAPLDMMWNGILENEDFQEYLGEKYMNPAPKR